MIPLEIQTVIAVFVGVTMVVYLVVLVLLATAKSLVLRNSFYQLNIALGIADMGNVCFSLIYFKLEHTNPHHHINLHRILHFKSRASLL